jgi:hypothetical protein
MCARVGPAHMRPLPAEGMAGKRGRCVLVAHMWPFHANRMAGNEGMCVRAAHLCRIPASCSRTCGRFRPGFRLADGKPGEVRELESEKWQETGGGARETPGNPGRCARTSAGSVPSGREVGRSQGEVRDSMDRTEGMCARVAHMWPLRARGMVGAEGMCASGRRQLARNRHKCANRNAHQKKKAGLPS